MYLWHDAHRRILSIRYLIYFVYSGITIVLYEKHLLNERLAHLNTLEAKFKVGDLVALRTNPGTLIPVIEVIIGGPEIRYSVYQNNRKTTYYESQLLEPEQLGTSSHLSAKELRAYLTSLQLLLPSTANLYSLRSGRVHFVPYQYRPVLRLIQADRPRLLIADEVGIGKTIEAGLIIKELRARMDIATVLVICPKALVAERKWELEMKRFDEHFATLDGQTLRYCLQETNLEGEWPDRYAKAILPFSLFNAGLIFGESGGRRRPNNGLLALDPPPKFDLVIVDEAHHIRNSETYLHQGVRYFCDHSQAAVFLTATPVQLGSHDLFSLLNVLRSDLVIDRSSFEQMASPNEFINLAVRHCRTAEDDWQTHAHVCLDKAADTEWGNLFLRESPVFQNVSSRLEEKKISNAERVRLIQSLEELYTFRPMINRTRRRDIGDFTTRKPETMTIEFTSDQRRLNDDLLDVVERILTQVHGRQNVKFMMTTIRRQAASCLYGLAPLLRDILSERLDRLEMLEENDFEADSAFFAEIRSDVENILEMVENLDPYDPKVEAFVKFVQEKSQMDNNKALVFSTFLHTLAYIEEHLQRVTIRYGVIHGGVADEERSDLRRRFALPKNNPDALDVLLSSEVGSEGLDFQFCDLLVNYDLPWNPMRVEQRIGRIDRYGQQSETVAIVNLVTSGTVDADIYERCLWRIGVFHQAVGGSEEILGEITSEIQTIADNFTLTPDERAERLQQLSDNKIRQIEEEMALEEKQAELFGLKIPNEPWRAEIESAENVWLSSQALQHCVEIYLAGLDEVETKPFLGMKSLKSLRLNRNARNRLLDDFNPQYYPNDQVARQWEKWLKGSDANLPVTFEQETATAESGVIHLNVLHPLVRQAAHYLERSDVVNVSLSASSEDLPTGRFPFALYRWQKVGIRVDDTLVAVTLVPQLDPYIMNLLVEVDDGHVGTALDDEVLNALDKQHHGKWDEVRANHISENRELVQHRLQSLKTSNRAQRMLLEDQIEKATNERIQRMKKSELERATNDYNRRVSELEKASESADVHTMMVVCGELHITRSKKTE